MTYFKRDNIELYYEDSGEDLPAVLLLAPGGMKSSIALWDKAPWDPRDALRQFRGSQWTRGTLVTPERLSAEMMDGTVIQRISLR